MLRPALIAWLAVFPAALCCSCSGKEAVSVSASLGKPAIQVDKTPLLVSSLSGSFDIYLELGKRASGSVDVTISSFSLVGAESGTDLLAKPLSFAASPPSPIGLAPGDTREVHLTLESPSSPGKPIEISKDEAAGICSAGQLKIVGTLHDSSGETLPVSSLAFSPSGC